MLCSDCGNWQGRKSVAWQLMYKKIQIDKIFHLTIRIMKTFFSFVWHKIMQFENSTKHKYFFHLKLSLFLFPRFLNRIKRIWQKEFQELFLSFWNQVKLLSYRTVSEKNKNQLKLFADDKVSVMNLSPETLHPTLKAEASQCWKAREVSRFPPLRAQTFSA